MGKRSKFERNPRDFYPTPYEAVIPLIPFIQFWGIEENMKFYEPCAGDGALIRHLTKTMKCCGASDINPQNPPHESFIKTIDCLELRKKDLNGADYIITNPPWDRELLQPILDHLLTGRTKFWFLLSGDWMHTKWAILYLRHCTKIVSIGRVKWIPASKFSSKENSCWYLFEPERFAHDMTVFYPRLP